MGLFGYTPVDWDVLAGTAYLLLGCPRMSWDILGHNRMPWAWDCLDIQQLTGMTWDIPGYRSGLGCPRTSYGSL